MIFKIWSKYRVRNQTNKWLMENYNSELQKGRVADINSCPIANVMKRKLHRKVAICFQNVAWVRETSPSWHIRNIELPEYVSQFIKYFDDGKYPDLILQEKEMK